MKYLLLTVLIILAAAAVYCLMTGQTELGRYLSVAGIIVGIPGLILADRDWRYWRRRLAATREELERERNGRF